MTHTAVPLIDLRAEYQEIRSEIDPEIQNVLESGAFILGPKERAFENDLALFHGVPYAVGVNSGTDALVLLLRTLQLTPGDEVIVPAFSFFATAEAVVLAGGKPVFADIDRETLTMDPASVLQLITGKTRAIIAVHLYGLMADMPLLSSIARQHKLALFEDNAQAIGAERNGVRAGNAADGAALSFFPTKNLGGYGDGGAVLVNSRERARQIQMLRAHGSVIKYDHEDVGYNSRLDELQAAILRVKLRRLDEWTGKRRVLAARYHAELRRLPLTLPIEPSAAKHVYHLYTIQTDKRGDLKNYLESQHIACAVHYPKPMHRQKAMVPYAIEADCPVSDIAARTVLSLPLYPQMTEAQQDLVIQALKLFYGKSEL